MLQLDTVGLSNDEQFSKLEIRFIRHHLKDAEAEIDRIDERRRQLTKNVCRYIIAIAPHKRLPEDVIRCIFECVVQDGTIEFPFKRVKMGLAPPQVVLSHVCSAWRRIILDMKSPWSRITVIPRKNFHAFCETWSPRILPRIRVDLTFTDFKTQRSFWDTFLHFQFKELEFIMNDEQLDLCCELFNGMSFKVERLGLEVRQRYNDVSLPQFLSHPLHSFKILSGYRDRHIDVSFPVPWAQLQCLDLCGARLNSSTATVLLRQCTSLEVCSLTLCHMHDTDVMATDIEQVTLPILRKLEIHLMEGTSMDALSHFLLPSLRILEIQGGGWRYDIRQVFRKQLNFHQLHELDIEEVNRSPTVVSILKDAPLLRRLSLSKHAQFDEECLCGLGNGKLGRHLELLRLYDLSCTIDGLRKMVEARLETRRLIPGIAPLFHVQFIQGQTGAAQNTFLVVNNDMRIELC